jgi:hypothetical protein
LSIEHGVNVVRAWSDLPQQEITKFPDLELAELVKERTNKTCPPQSERNGLLLHYHQKGHFGAEKLYSALWESGRYWPGMHRQCVETVSSCLMCARHNVSQRGFHPARPVHATYPWEHLALDLMELPTSATGSNYALVCVCVFTKFTLCGALANKSASSCAEQLWQWISVFGVPKIIQSDNGSEFVNSTMKALTDLIGVSHNLTAPYNPRANGAAERAVQTCKQTLKKLAAGNIRHWDRYLPAVQMCINAEVASLTNSAPVALMFARPVNPFADFKDVKSNPLSVDQLLSRNDQVINILHPEIAVSSFVKRSAAAAGTDKRRRVRKPFAVGDKVMIKDVMRRNKMEPYFVGPYTVVKRTRAKTYQLLSSDSTLLGRTVPADQMRIVAKKPGSGDALDESTYTVDRILKHRGPEGEREYLIKWQGYDLSEATWEPESNIYDTDVISLYWNTVDEEQLDANSGDASGPSEHDVGGEGGGPAADMVGEDVDAHRQQPQPGIGSGVVRSRRSGRPVRRPRQFDEFLDL